MRAPKRPCDHFAGVRVRFFHSGRVVEVGVEEFLGGCADGLHRSAE